MNPPCVVCFKHIRFIKNRLKKCLNLRNHYISVFFVFAGGYTGAVKPPVRRTGNRESGHKETGIFEA